ncbi:hypothetical protein [Kitasatospora arboriphila]|uniref:Uncharacterized protein n=1 Tax=Kitasatospora arboriphila TaxID=258052 RepID=A0ABN1U838_9ACTN
MGQMWGELWTPPQPEDGVGIARPESSLREKVRFAALAAVVIVVAVLALLAGLIGVGMSHMGDPTG